MSSFSVLHRQRRMHDHPRGHVDDEAERREVLHRVVRQLAHQRRIDHEAAGHDPGGVAVGRALRDDLRADHAARAGAVVDDEVAGRAISRHLRRQQAEEDVAVAARRGGVDHAQRLRSETSARRRSARAPAKEEGARRKEECKNRVCAPEHRIRSSAIDCAWSHRHFAPSDSVTPHSGSIPAARATLIHFAISALLKLSYASGVLPTGSAPWPDEVVPDGRAR